MPPLCAPDGDLSCFGCCPPIRPHHYDVLDFVGSLRRELSENRTAFLNTPLLFKPIVGYHCWALGFLDPKGRTVGCLLHPSRHEGRDYRDLIDYGNKCRRESCQAACVFEELPEEGQRFWLSLVNGLNAFYYSSHRANPLFHLLLWGSSLLEELRRHAVFRGWSATELVHACPFLTHGEWHPKAHRYLFGLVIEQLGTEPNWTEIIEDACRRLLFDIQGHPAVRELKDIRSREELVLTHQAAQAGEFLDFVRLGLGIERVSVSQLGRFLESVNALASTMR